MAKWQTAYIWHKEFRSLRKVSEPLGASGPAVVFTSLLSFLQRSHLSEYLIFGLEIDRDASSSGLLQEDYTSLRSLFFKIEIPSGLPLGILLCKLYVQTTKRPMAEESDFVFWNSPTKLVICCFCNLKQDTQLLNLFSHHGNQTDTFCLPISLSFGRISEVHENIFLTAKCYINIGYHCSFIYHDDNIIFLIPEP